MSREERLESGVWSLAASLPAILICLLAAALVMAGEAAPAIPAPSDAAVSGFRIGAEADTARFFAERIAPVFAKHCYECHGGKKKYGGLKMDTLEGALKGGYDFGPGIVPWHPDKSSIVESIRWTNDDEDMRMPPNKKLPDAVVADIARWVAMGAPWPVEAGPGAMAALVPERQAPLFGRLHPALVHLPIAALLLAVVFAGLALRREATWRAAMRLSLGITVLSGALAIISGTMWAGEEPSALLVRHQQAGWAAIILALIALVTDLLARERQALCWLARLMLLAAVVAVALAGHWGGEMVHGPWF